MLTFLIVLGGLVLLLVGAGFWSTNSRRPKFFKGKLKPPETYGVGNQLQEEMLFPRKDVLKLASLSFIADGQKFTAEFQTYNGYVAEMIVRPSPRIL